MVHGSVRGFVGVPREVMPLAVSTSKVVSGVVRVVVGGAGVLVLGTVALCFGTTNLDG